MTGSPLYEYQSDESLIQMNLYEHLGDGVLTPIYLTEVGPPAAPTIPLAPVLLSTSTLTSQTSATLYWTAPVNTGRPPITGYNVYVSVDGAAESFLETTAATVLTAVESGLPTGSPEKVFAFTVRAVNDDGAGDASNTVTLQWAGTVVQQPTAPTGLSKGSVQPTSAVLSWVETSDATVDKHGIFQNNTLIRDGLDPVAKTYTLTGLIPNTVQSGLNVRRHNAWTGGTPVGWSPASNIIPNFTTPSVTQTAKFAGHQPGKIYLGFARADGSLSLTGNGPHPSDVMDTDGSYFPVGYNTRDGWRVLGGWDTGASIIGTPASNRLGVRRFYSKDTAAINAAYADDVMMFLSAKPDDFGASAATPAGWSTVANGSTTIDNNIRSYFSSLVDLNRPLLFCFAHEPVGNVKPDTNGTAAAAWCNAWRHILDVFEAEYGTDTKIIFAPNIEGFCWTTKVSTVGDLRNWFPADLIARWDLITTDLYHNKTDSPGVLFSTRMAKVENWFKGTYTQPGANGPNLNTFTPGVDKCLGLGEFAGRYKYYRDSGSNVTAAQWFRDAMDYIYARPDIYPIACRFNSIGVEDERLELAGQPARGSTHADTETNLDIMREKLLSPITCKISDIGL